MDLAEKMVLPIIPKIPTINRASLTIGYAGVYSTFLLHAQHAARKFGVDTREILIELGSGRRLAGRKT
jgi:4-hydroxy-2-oxovalerate/4-hydroxy-2-oxohexanoate aldolase